MYKKIRMESAKPLSVHSEETNKNLILFLCMGVLGHLKTGHTLRISYIHNQLHNQLHN